VLGESAVAGDGDAEGLARFLSREPTPEDAAQFADQYERLLVRLEDATLKTIALRRLEGYSSVEIASGLGTTARTVDRKLGLIRAIWQEETAR
jgi:DNA-directed RNA polymerase specialized sigma24 family protein